MSFELVAIRANIEKVDSRKGFSDEGTMLLPFTSLLTALHVEGDVVRAQCMAGYVSRHSRFAKKINKPLAIPTRNFAGYVSVGMNGLVFQEFKDTLSGAEAAPTCVVAIQANSGLGLLTGKKTKETSRRQIRSTLEPVARQMAFACLQLYEDPELTAIKVTQEYADGDFPHKIMLPESPRTFREQIRSLGQQQPDYMY